MLYLNTYSVTGVWNGFDLEWLECEIVARTARTGLSARIALLRRLRRYLVTRSTWTEWLRLREMLPVSHDHERPD